MISRHYVEWIKPILKFHILHESIYRTFSKWQDYRDGKHTSGDQERGSGARENVGLVSGENSVVLEQFCILFVVVVTQIYTFDKMA